MNKTRKPSTWRSLVLSALSFFLCVVLLVGATFAWFTMQTDSARNIITAGMLKVELTHTNATKTDESVSSTTELFKLPSEPGYWEPGVMTYENLTVKNTGDMALKYQLSLNIYDYNYIQATGKSLLDVIKVCVVAGGLKPATEGSTVTREDAQAAIAAAGNEIFSLSDWATTGNLASGASSTPVGIILYWEPTAADSDYNVATAGKTNTDPEKPRLFVELGARLVATQDTVENDAFDEYYDKLAEFPNVPAIGTKASATVEVPEDRSNGMTIKNDLATLEIPAENIDNEASKYRLDIERIENIEEGQEGAVALSSDTNTLVTFDVSLVKITASTETPVSGEAPEEYNVTLYVGTHCELVKLYHKGEEIIDFTYNPANGEVTYKTKSFSPYAGEIKFAGGEGTEVYPYLLENAKQIQAISEYYDNGCGYDDGGNWFEKADVKCDFKYYKIADGIEHIDGSNWKPVYMAGSFDGNGVTFDNLSNTLFKEVYNSADKICEIKNIKIDAEIHSTGWISALVSNAASSMKISNVDVSGYIEGNNTSSYISFGFYNNYSIYNGEAADKLYPNGIPSYHITFENCHSDAYMVGYSNCSVFFNHANGSNRYNTDGKKDSITIKNSGYTGEMLSKNFRYVTANWAETGTCDLTIDPVDTDAISGYGNYEISSIKYVLKNKTIKMSGALSSDNIGDTIKVAKEEDAVKAVATLWIGTNPGNIYTPYKSEDCVLEDGNFVTIDIRNFTITLNKYEKEDAYDDGTKFNVNCDGDGTLACADIKIVQYDEDGNVVTAGSFSIPKDQYPIIK